MSKNTLLFIVFIIFLSACTSNTYDDITETESEPAPELVTYQDVKPIIDNACLSCHSNPPQNAAPNPLVSFQNVREAVLNRNLLNRISAPESDGALMPPGGPRLPQTSIDLLVEWEADGLLEN